MLKLTRRPFADEVIYISGDAGTAIAKVRVTSVNNGRVSLGFDPAKGVFIDRLKCEGQVHDVSFGGVSIAKVHVLGNRGNQVSLGFEADRSIAIVRGEIMTPEVVKQYERDLEL